MGERSTGSKFVARGDREILEHAVEHVAGALGAGMQLLERTRVASRRGFAVGLAELAGEAHDLLHGLAQIVREDQRHVVHFAACGLEFVTRARLGRSRRR